jgi:hypothetical protein
MTKTKLIIAVLALSIVSVTAKADVVGFDCKSANYLAEAGLYNGSLYITLNGNMLADGKVESYKKSRTANRIPDLASHQFTVTDLSGVKREIVINTVIKSSLAVGRDVDTGKFDSAILVLKPANVWGHGGAIIDLKCNIVNR